MEVVAFHAIEPGEEIVISCKSCLDRLPALSLTIKMCPWKHPSKREGST